MVACSRFPDGGKEENRTGGEGGGRGGSAGGLRKREGWGWEFSPSPSLLPNPPPQSGPVHFSSRLYFLSLHHLRAWNRLINELSATPKARYPKPNHSFNKVKKTVQKNTYPQDSRNVHVEDTCRSKKINAIKKVTILTLSLPRVINLNFPCSLTRNITSHGTMNLELHGFLRWKMIKPAILTTSITFVSMGVKG